MDLEARWQNLLQKLQAEGRYRQLLVPDGLDFSSNDYLGFGKQPLPAPSDLPASGSASRLLRGNHRIWQDVEEALAGWHGSGAALMFTSGYVANEGLLATIIEPGDFVASDQSNHASIIDGLRLSKSERFVYQHNDVDHLESGLRTAARKRAPGRQLFVVTESLFGMDGDRAPLATLVEICERHGAHLIVDEAHATGCFGPAGSGLVDAGELRQRILASIHTGGKALGVAGAYVCGSIRLRDLLINRCRHFVFTTALPPLIGACWMPALKRVRAADDRRRQLHAAAAFFRTELCRHGIDCRGRDYIVPIVLGDDRQTMAIAGHMQGAGWDIRAIRPPTVPVGTARLRICIHADHDSGTLTAVASALAQVLSPAAAGMP